MKGKIIFEEKQSFVGTWIWYLVCSISALSILGACFGFYFSTNSERFIGLIIVAIVTLALFVLFYTAKLSLIIDKDGLYYRYPPFVNRERAIRKENVKELYVRNYSPLREYGGWGYRYSFKYGRALNVSGSKGLQIVANNDKKILIGTQKPDQLERAIRQLKENWRMTNG